MNIFFISDTFNFSEKDFYSNKIPKIASFALTGIMESVEIALYG